MKTIIAHTEEEALKLQEAHPNDIIAIPSLGETWSPEFLEYAKSKGAQVIDTTKIPTGTVLFEGEEL